ncbi:acyl-CoA oxidase [Meredithblackwellia eburnea MCA 4105]
MAQKQIKKKPTEMETMAQERANPPFDVRRMTYALGGGQRDVELKEKFMVDIERDPNFRLDDIHDLTKNQIRERTMAKFGSMVHYVVNERLDVFTKRMELIGIADPAFWTRFGVHYGLFLGAIRSGATANQFSYWLEKGVLGLTGMVGCFAMTELAHGSNVAGLETTSTFDPDSDEFVIHTPSVSATKWWIGGAAQTATHSAVFARLIVKGVDYGTKTFIVPLRNPKTFALLPGISIGDIGKKMGRDGIDNGWIQFTNVRIPRAYMLMKHTQVTREGVVQEPPLAQLTYGALLQGRTAMVADAANVSKKALVIALRYAAVRRQFKVGHKEFESQILDYPIHQRRLIPLLSQAVAMGFTSLQMTKLFETMTSQLESFGPDSDAEETKEVLEKLKETHATSAGLKAFCTWNGLETIEKCRASCGGHGYSAYTGLASMYNDQAVQATWEGDNTILSLQSGRSLIGSYSDALKGTKLPLGTAYLNALPKVLSFQCASDKKAIDLETIDQGWACVAANCVKKAHDMYESFIKQGKQKDEALEMCSQERFIAAKIHTTGYIFRQFREGLAELAKTENPSTGVVATLEQICRLYGTWSVEENAQYFLKHKFYTPAQMDLITAEVTNLCAELRKCAVPLTDAFNYSDHIINSPLGVYSGDVYKVYFDRVRASNPHETVHPYFDRIIKPLLERDELVLDDADSIDLDEEISEIKQEREEALEEAGKNDDE